MVPVTGQQATPVLILLGVLWGQRAHLPFSHIQAYTRGRDLSAVL